MQRENFKSRTGFLLVSAGCAIGIGNVWRFPYVTGENGGGLFVLPCRNDGLEPRRYPSRCMSFGGRKMRFIGLLALPMLLLLSAARPDLKKDIKMAESERFELSIQVFPYTHFPGVLLQPLGQLSTMLYY